MAGIIKELTQTIGVRVSPEDVEKLAELARRLDRSPASVLRTLIRSARPAGIAEVVFNREGEVAHATVQTGE